MTEKFPLFWIPLLPLLGAAFNILLGRKLHRQVVHVVGCGTVLASLGVVLVATFSHLYPLWRAVNAAHVSQGAAVPLPALVNTVFSWIAAGRISIDLGLILDPLSAVMVLVVTLVGLLIHVYSTGYMGHDRDYARFFGYMNLFTGAMLLLVLGDNLLVLFVGWEGVGLCSYLLIGFWYDKDGTAKEGDANATAGRKAFIVNRIGDFAFILGMFLIFSVVGTLSIGEMAARSQDLLQSWQPFPSSLWLNVFLPGVGSLLCGRPSGLVMLALVVGGGMMLYHMYGFRRLAGLVPLAAGWAWSIVAGLGLPAPGAFSVAGVAAILLFIGATGKSAQIPLYVWLPDAMAGPTPVSALIHAATMVTAGVYMVARLNFLYMLSPLAMGVVALVGAATALYAATIGFAQNDIKKVLAYSTISQLGYMFLGVGVGAFAAGIFHLFTHAFFKACLFLGAGAVIHAMSGKQDITEMGGLSRRMPLTHATFWVSCVAICGIPLFSGFFSKDEILFSAISTANPAWPAWFPYLLYVLALAGALCTAFYMFRLYYLTFSGESRADEHTRSKIHEQPSSMTMPLLVLAAGAAVLGFLGLPRLVGEHVNIFHSWLAPVVERGQHLAARAGVVATVKAAPLAESHEAEGGLMLLSVLVAVAGIWVARRLYRGGFSPRVEEIVGKIPRLHHAVAAKYRIDELYHVVFAHPLRWTSMLFWKAIDTFLIDMVGVNGSAWLVDKVGGAVRRLQNGSLQRYIVGVVAGLGVVVFFTTCPPDHFEIRPGARVTVGQRVTFDATRPVTADRRRLEYCWDFDGDGQKDRPCSESPTADHVYSQRATYNVTLRVQDRRWGTVATESRTLEVR